MYSKGKPSNLNFPAYSLNAVVSEVVAAAGAASWAEAEYESAIALKNRQVRKTFLIVIENGVKNIRNNKQNIRLLT